MNMPPNAGEQPCLVDHSVGDRGRKMPEPPIKCVRLGGLIMESHKTDSKTVSNKQLYQLQLDSRHTFMSLSVLDMECFGNEI